MQWLWPTAGKVIDGFDAPRNKGIDIGGNEGEPVQAAADGEVVHVGSALRGYGNLVIIRHAGRLRHRVRPQPKDSRFAGPAGEDAVSRSRNWGERTAIARSFTLRYVTKASRSIRSNTFLHVEVFDRRRCLPTPSALTVRRSNRPPAEPRPDSDDANFAAEVADARARIRGRCGAVDGHRRRARLPRHRQRPALPDGHRRASPDDAGGRARHGGARAGGRLRGAPGDDRTQPAARRVDRQALRQPRAWRCSTSSRKATSA